MLIQPVNAAAQPPDAIYIGTYTGAKSQGIYAARFDAASGRISAVDLAAKTESPSFLALHPNGRWLYAVGESSAIGPKKDGTVTAYKLQPGTLQLEKLNQQPAGGSGPCHLSVDPTGKCVLVANYGSGSIAAFPIREHGQLGEAGSVIQHTGSSVNQQRQAGPHAHFIMPCPRNDFALACDLGLDKVLVYKFDPAEARLAPNEVPSASVQAGQGPRHLAMHPRGRLVFVLNEMGSTVTTFSFDAKKGTLLPLGMISTLPDGFSGNNSCAEIQVRLSGDFLYASNRGHDSIAVYALDEKSGKLTLVQHQATEGKTPRYFGLDPSGQWLLAGNQDSDTITTFKVDQKTGQLSYTGQSVEVGKPVCVVFARSL